MKPLIAPSILSADMGRLADEISAVEAAGADLIHIDVMDGHFVTNLAMGPKTVRAVKKYSNLPLDVHLMISNPLDYIDSFAESGADMISFHSEATCTPLRVVDRIRELGIKPGIVLNPATPVSHLYEVLEELDYVLLLCVEPGFGNQSFRRPVLKKINQLLTLRREKSLTYRIEVDGGVNKGTIRDAAEAGADIFVVGSAVFDRSNYTEEIKQMRTLIDMEKVE